MNNELYYFITVFSKYDDKGPHNMRCWGFYNSFEDAHMVVENNITDIWETIYDFAVIEEYHPGISGYNFYRVLNVERYGGHIFYIKNIVIIVDFLVVVVVIIQMKKVIVQDGNEPI